jgi:hypothetical protein
MAIRFLFALSALAMSLTVSASGISISGSSQSGIGYAGNSPSRPLRPLGIALNHDGTRAFVALSNVAAVIELDLITGRTVRQISCDNPRTLAIHNRELLIATAGSWITKSDSQARKELRREDPSRLSLRNRRSLARSPYQKSRHRSVTRSRKSCLPGSQPKNYRMGRLHLALTICRTLTLIHKIF